MTRICLLVQSLLLIGVLHAQKNIEGVWEGKLQLDGGYSLRLVFHIKKEANTFKGTMDSPDQGAKGIALSKVELSGDSLLMEVASIGGKASGKIAGDSTFTGEWKQGMATLPLDLKKVAKPTELKRPQTPKPPFAYQTEDILYYKNDKSIQYGATVTVPNGKGPFPAVLLITGSGQQNRDEELFGHKPFAVIADYLTKQGYVVLRVDDRGVGKTTGDVESASSKDFAEDVKVGLDYLKARKEVAKAQIGLLGHSEGGMIAQIVAAERADIAFVISLAGPGQKIIDLMANQNRAILQTMGVSKEAIESYVSFYKVILPAVVNAPSDSAAKSIAISMLSDWVKKTPKETVLATSGISEEKEIEKTAIEYVSGLRSPWFTYFLNYDPDRFIRNIKAKVLVLNGEKDIQVVSQPNLAGWKTSLAKSSVKKYAVTEMKGLNHLFQRCTTCTVPEYGQLEETIAPEVLQTISNWLKANINK